MSMISEFVSRLRQYANVSLYAREYEAKELLRQAADTIEVLSTKLQEANMKRSERDYDGGWIPCSERLPEPGIYLVTCDDADYPVKRMRMKGICFYDHYGIYDGKVYAWMPLPEPYQSKLLYVGESR